MKPRESIRIPSPLIDLEIRITTPWGSGGRSLEFVLHSPSGAVDFFQVTIPGKRIHSPEAFQKQLFQQLEELQQGRELDGGLVLRKEAFQDLERIGHDLYQELFPREMRTVYRELRDQITTLLIVSDEPWIPWEMLRPFEFPDDDFLCMTFQMSRWLTGEAPLATKKRITRLVGLEPEADRRPPNARRELRLLEDLVDSTSGIAGLFPLQVTAEEVTRILEEESFDLLHYVGHGRHDEEKPSEAKVMLDDRAYRTRHLPPTAEAKLRRKRPVVFFNACQSGRVSQSLADLEGWAPRWINRFGCSAFIAPFWSVRDQRAFRFAQIFYQGLQEGLTLGQAVLQARHQLRDEDPYETTWLAYSLYGHPAAQIFFGADRSDEPGLETVSLATRTAVEPPSQGQPQRTTDGLARQPTEEPETPGHHGSKASEPTEAPLRSHSAVRPSWALIATRHWKVAIVALLTLPLALGILGQMTHSARETLLRLSSPLSYPTPTLVWTGAEALGSLTVNALTSPFSSRFEIGVSAWGLIALAIICWVASRSKRRWPKAGLVASLVAMALTASLLWLGIHLYTFALRARHPEEQPADSKALCSSYFLRDPAKPEQPASITERIVVESCRWLEQPTEAHEAWRQGLSGLVVFFLLSTGLALRSGLAMGRQRGGFEGARRVLIATHALMLFLILRQLPLAHAYYHWGLQYPSVTQVDGPYSDSFRTITEGKCCVYDVSEGANETILLSAGQDCPLQREQRWDVDRPHLERQTRRLVTAECPRGERMPPREPS